MNKLQKLIQDPKKLFPYLARKGWFDWMPDKLYLRCMFRCRLGYKLDLDDPQTFNEKLQWLKLYDRRPAYTMMVDKYAVREYIADTIGEEYLIPLLGVWDRAEDIDFDTLPEQFVLKCTHDSGGLVICRDKSKLDVAAAKRKLSKCLERNYYWGGREWPYKDVKPRVIAERYMVDESGYELKDYKVFCFNGCARVIQVDFDRFSGHTRNMYSPSWDYLCFASQYPTDPKRTIQQPDNLDDMLALAGKLSKGYPHVRIDFYSINTKTYFGETTFFHECGFGKYTPFEWDYTLGSWLTLPKKGY